MFGDQTTRMVWRLGGGWTEVRATLEQLPPRAEVIVPLGAMPHPSVAGARRSVGLARGQRADWRFAPARDCTGLHVHEFATSFVAHLDAVHPACSVLGHLQADAPQVLVGFSAGLGALGGLVAGKSLVGAAAGALVGVILAARRGPHRSG